MKNKTANMLALGVALAFLAGATMVEADVVPLVNPSFEEPGTAKIKGWNGEAGDDIPGWASDGPAVDSGVESDWPGSTDGAWSGFMMAGDPAAWQLTGHTIQAGEIFSLRVDGRNNWSEFPPALLGLTLYYDDAGTRVPAATAAFELIDDWTEQTLDFDVSVVPGSVGKLIGIELSNPTTPGSWIGIDNVRLDVVPEPGMLALLAVGAALIGLRRRR